MYAITPGIIDWSSPTNDVQTCISPPFVFPLSFSFSRELRSSTTNPAQAAAGTATVGQSVTFSVTCDGTAPFTYQWSKNDANIAGATGATYSISSVQLTDAGTYCVVVSNSAGSTTSDNATLTVNPAAGAPVVTTQPASQTVTAGASVTFTAAASGSPAPTYQWRKNGTNISGGTSASYTIASVVAGDAGTYTVVATNSAGSATSNGAVLTVNTAPAITVQPVNQTVAAGQNATFSVTVGGNPPPTYQWQRSVDGGTTWNNLTNDNTYTGVTTATLMIISPTAGMNGDQFRCLLTNSVGSVASNAAVLAVNGPPSNVQIAIRIN